MTECIFCKIASGEIPCYKVWEDEKHLAFLSPRGNTEGFTVVITKEHYPSYAFNLPNKVLTDLVLATKKVTKLIDKNIKDVGRCGMIFEGFGINHVHSKIFPMHGTNNLNKWKPIESKMDKFFDKYEGYISSHDISKKQSDEKLKDIAKKIKGEENDS
ncbi:HIT family protein [Candidatus Pacearchaeota archaeon]|nr:hypothetical protein [uncultured archaeon]MBS3084528.1 HIT family protein [Candidatus Pacearchaeota archaeon]